MADPKLLVPGEVVSVTDVARLVSEVASLNDFFASGGGAKSKIPSTSSSLDRLAKLNKLNLLKAEDREFLGLQLQLIFDKAPVIKVSFARDPSRAQLVKILNWMRKNLKSDILLKIGLRPDISGGCIFEIDGNIYDFGLRSYFWDKRKYLHRAIHNVPAAPSE